LTYGPAVGRSYSNQANERLRILGEIPADVPFTSQTLDKDGLVLNVFQTWHQLWPGGVRNDCGGCQAHAQVGTDFSTTEATQPNYRIPDLTLATSLLSKNLNSEDTIVTTQNTGAVDVECYCDIKPILRRSCVPCHSLSGIAPAGLIWEDVSVINGHQTTYNRLAHDSDAQYGIPSVISNGKWRTHQRLTLYSGISIET